MRAYAPLIGAGIGLAFVAALIAVGYFFGPGGLMLTFFCLVGAVAGGRIGIEFME